MVRITVRFMITAMAILLLARSVSGQAPQDEIVYYHVDAIGSVRAITDNNGQTVQRLDFLPFGEPWPTAGTERLQFTGAQRDSSTGFTYLMARYLLVNAGRFTSPDEAVYSDAVNPQSWNLYVYVTNRPLTFIDPSGHDECVNMSTNTSATVICPTAWEQIMQNLIAVSQRYPPTVPTISLAGVGPVPLAPPGVPSCANVNEIGDFGAIRIRQPRSGSLFWDVDIKPIVGVLRVTEGFKYTGRRHEIFTGKPYPYFFRGGTTHGSRHNLEVGSRYNLFANAFAGPVLIGTGFVSCRVE